jgi:hypothetical protein
LTELVSISGLISLSFVGSDRPLGESLFWLCDALVTNTRITCPDMSGSRIAEEGYCQLHGHAEAQRMPSPTEFQRFFRDGRYELRVLFTFSPGLAVQHVKWWLVRHEQMRRLCTRRKEGPSQTGGQKDNEVRPRLATASANHETGEETIRRLATAPFNFETGFFAPLDCYLS